MVSAPLTIPTKTQVVGVGRGDAGINTVIKATASFPKGQPLVTMGLSTQDNFGVQISNLTLDGSSLAGVCLANWHSQEQSWGRGLMLDNCSTGLLVAGSSAQNSGPFEDLEVYPGSGTFVNANTLCIQIANVPEFRGVKSLTCNAGTMYSVRPAVAMAIDGAGFYSDIHVEHFATAISLGNAVDAADGMTIIGTSFGPDVSTGVLINGGVNNQDVQLFGIQCFGCPSLINDQVLGNNISDNSTGWYMIGNGGGAAKTFYTSKYGLWHQVFGNQLVSGNMIIGPSDPGWGGTLTIWDATPSTGVTSVIEMSGAGQGGTDLHQWRDQWNNVQTRVAGDGSLHTSSLQVFAWTQPACNSSARGLFSYVPNGSGAPDHLQVCIKDSTDNYSWKTVF